MVAVQKQVGCIVLQTKAHAEVGLPEVEPTAEKGLVSHSPFAALLPPSEILDPCSSQWRGILRKVLKSLQVQLLLLNYKNTPSSSFKEGYSIILKLNVLIS